MHRTWEKPGRSAEIPNKVTLSREANGERYSYLVFLVVVAVVVVLF